MSESVMRGHVTAALSKLDGRAVENPIDPGFPDVNYVEGLIELKWLPKWPKREHSVVTIEHYTPVQRIFHERRSKAGGKIHVMFQVGKTWMLFEGRVAAAYLGLVDRETLERVAMRIWFSRESMQADLPHVLNPRP